MRLTGQRKMSTLSVQTERKPCCGRLSQLFRAASEIRICLFRLLFQGELAVLGTSCVVVASRRVVSRSCRVASRRVASRRVASRRVASRRVASRRVASRRVASRRTRIGHNPWSAACNSWRWRESNRRGRNCVRPCQREFYAANQVKDRVRQRPLLTVNDRNSVSFLYSWVVFASRSPAHWMTGGSIRAIGGG